MAHHPRIDLDTDLQHRNRQVSPASGMDEVLGKTTGVPIAQCYHFSMAKNGPKGKGRTGTVKGRSQVLSGRNKRWTKVSTATGRFVDQMARKGRAFKGVKMK